MGIISQTLGEILDIPNYQLFFPHEIMNYERLQSLIVNNFYNREIAYDTVDYFRMKLNYYLEINADRYNKMLSSERVTFDPFMSDYSEQYATSNRNESIGHAERERETIDNTVDTVSGRTNTHNENTKSTTDVVSGLVKDTTLDTKMLSNTNDVNEQTGQENSKTDTTGRSETNETENTVTDTTGNTKTTQTAETTTDRTSDTTTKRTWNNNQTARDWSEKGNSSGHNLDVNSDTPMSMLFNTPNHYYGTGTAGDYGVASGDGYIPYMEEDINAMESSPRSINGGETPWYNYATSAGNRIGKDNYAKSGDETYSRSGDENTSQNTVENETQHSTSNGNVDSTENQTSKVTGNSVTDNSSNMVAEVSTKENAERNINTNETEEQKGNTTQNAKSNTVFVSDKTSGDQTDTKTNETGNREGKRNKTFKEKTHSTDKTRVTRSGRTNRSPSKLLLEYRETLTYSADLFMMGELEKCFLQIY